MPDSQTVLVIEDEVGMHETMRRLLRKKFNAEAYFVKTGEEAIRALESSDWHLVISDWDLDTGMDGGEVLLWVLNHKPDLISRYVFFSSSSRAEEMVVGSGIPFIRKPAGADVLVATLSPFFATKED